MCNISWLGSNIGEVCFKNNNELHSLYAITIGEINNKTIGKWFESVNDEDKRVSMEV